MTMTRQLRQPARHSSIGLRALRLVLLALSLLCALRAPLPADEPATSEAAKPAQPANRLAKETSPYLLLHAHNPVDWYPWGDEALAKARAENKLIFLSIGYASCYWCHVMERESFMDAAVAAHLNKHYVCIKVDREERPDIDQIYMTALGVMGRHGGWPLTMILTPSAHPIIGGTYFPPRDKTVDIPGKEGAPAQQQQVTGLTSFLNLVDDAWRKNPAELLDYAAQVSGAVKRSMRQRVAVAPPAKELPQNTRDALAEQFDRQYGGFSYSEANPRRPKFPEPTNLLFLLELCQAGDDPQARQMLDKTLQSMATGGIRDHLGGGFHRYSTDRYWRVPHFEKMLYDNALLATVYATAFRQSANPEYRRVVEELLAFVSRELTAPEGGFYAALDAETDGDEGSFYLWTADEILQALGPTDAQLFRKAYGADGAPDIDDRYVLKIAHATAELATEQESVAALDERLATLRQKLLAARAARPRPRTDTKILTAWNGLMIRGFADAGRLLENEHYIQTAQRAAEFVLTHLRTPDGRLQRSYAGGRSQLNAYLDDYAFLVDGLLALHEATGEARWLTTADELTRTQIELFWDEEQHGFFFTADDHEELIARSKDPVDSATPSGNAIAASNLIYLARVQKSPELRTRAEQTIACFAGLLKDTPASLPRMVQAWMALDRAK